MSEGIWLECENFCPLCSAKAVSRAISVTTSDVKVVSYCVKHWFPQTIKIITFIGGFNSLLSRRKLLESRDREKGFAIFSGGTCQLLHNRIYCVIRNNLLFSKCIANTLLSRFKHRQRNNYLLRGKTKLHITVNRHRYNLLSGLEKKS